LPSHLEARRPGSALPSTTVEVEGEGDHRSNDCPDDDPPLEVAQGVQLPPHGHEDGPTDGVESRITDDLHCDHFPRRGMDRPQQDCRRRGAPVRSTEPMRPEGPPHAYHKLARSVCCGVPTDAPRIARDPGDCSATPC
ncbi:MAG: hypothetical protein J2P37_34885, partial [Ktedonobacteraceae bacterium]|nr:hypothetical protein [Ktedonobacteraceae bacterium]